MSNVRQLKQKIIMAALLLTGLASAWGMDATVRDDILSGQKVASAIEDENSRQLRIYGDALLHGVRDSIRLDAAMGLLLRKDQPSQELLLQALGAEDNVPARVAVCRALIKGRGIAGGVSSQDIYLVPLIDALKSLDSSLARVAAEALLVFPYNTASRPICGLAGDSSLEKQVRLNAIYAIQLRPEPEVLKDLTRLLDDSDFEIVRAAELALQESFGVPVGTSKAVWAKIIKELEQKDPSEIRRERLLRQETRLREIQAERERWQKLYLGSLDKEYELLETSLKTAYLQEKLATDMPAIRLWALDKLQRYPAESALPLRDKLLFLLSDENRQVRFMTARVLSTMSALDPAEKLLERYKEETDPQVGLAIFEALGEACFFAFSPGSKIILPAEIKTQTFQIADSYAEKDDPEMAKKGAEVLRKLLELDGITQQEAQYYMQTILDRYNHELEKKGTIKGDLLSIMARLCGQGSQKALAGKIYSKTFAEVLETKDENNLVRQAAALGFVNIDKTEAIKLFRSISLYNDSSPAVRQIMIDLAGQTGTVEDLEWLTGLLSVNGQIEPVWQSIELILQRCDAEVAVDWATRFESNPLLKEQIRDLLEIAEQKALAQKKDELVCNLQVRLIRWNLQNGFYEQVLVYREKLSQETRNFKEYAISALRKTDSNAVDAYLQLRQFDKAASLIGNLLSGKIIKDNSDVLNVIDCFFKSEGVSVLDKKGLLAALNAITVDSDMAWWQLKLDFWNSIELKENPIEAVN